MERSGVMEFCGDVARSRVMKRCAGAVRRGEANSARHRFQESVT